MGKNIYDNNLKKLQKKLKEDGVKAYVVQVTDPHQTEEAAPRYLEERMALSSYKGSDGLLLVTQDHSYLYADGRYWVEALEELKGTNTQLVKMGDFNVPTMSEFIKTNDLFPLAMDFSTMSIIDFERFAKGVPAGKILDKSYRELIVGKMSLPLSDIWKVDSSLLSTTYYERLCSVINGFKKQGAKATFISTLDDIAYILGWRGNDLECSPLFLSYLYIDESGQADLFIRSNKVPEELPGLRVHDYSTVWDFLKQINLRPVPTLLDKLRTNERVLEYVKDPIFAPNPSQFDKSVKGKVEIENTKRIHELDALAVFRLYAWVKKHIMEKGEQYSEYEIAKVVDGYRREREECYALSFPTISAFRGHGAMMHYLPEEKGSSIVSNEGVNPILLVDSGGQYYGGTTDITRTWCLGKADKEYIHDYTLTVKSVMDLASTIFLQGCSGVALDIKARENMWREGMDYKCGTGHGVGYMLNVHEAPNGFRYKIVPERDDSHELVPGQIQSDEPGVYKAGKYGIRIENEILIVRKNHTSDGYFNEFENITYCPLQRSMIDVNLLSDFELTYLNAYQMLCRKILLPYVEKDEELKTLLIEETKPLVRKE